MTKKTTITYCIFTIALLYIVSPWFFEKQLFFNELLSLTGFSLLIYKRFKPGNDIISVCMVMLLGWSAVHLLTSLFRMDSFYYYLRNSVIVYSMFSFYIGFYCLRYLDGYIQKINIFLRLYVAIFLFIPLSKLFFERFGMAMLFPALLKGIKSRYVPLLLVVLNCIYAISYDSSTAMAIAAFYLLILISPGYKFFSRVMLIGFILFGAFFIYFLPNFSLVSHGYSHHNDVGIINVRNSHPLLSLDANSTWRLVLWKEIIVDNFPSNIFGLGFGTPLLKYYPVEDYTKLATLPYVMGAHNSFVYLFGRLGIIYLLLLIPIYIGIFREYFSHKAYYYANNQLLIFFSFFAITIIAVFNPTLESPIYASAYWMLLGFVARAIYNREQISKQSSLS